MKCFHHTDMDGKCSAAIVKKYYNTPQDSFPETYHPINYNMDFPFDEILPGESVIIVDFSLQKEGDFKKLLSITKDVVWIDHHKTAIERHTGMKHLKGIRKDGVAGCQLAWDFFFPGRPTPKMVKFLADYDVWKFEFGEDTKDIQAGVRVYDTRPESEEWVDWLGESNLWYVFNSGKTIRKYQENKNRGLIKAWSYHTTLLGWKIIACNVGSTSSQLFDSVDDSTYDIMVPFVFDGKQWTVSLYTKKDSIDVSEIAKHYGGGGHKKAAGFQCKELPWPDGLDIEEGNRIGEVD